jgi:hypothetical protein
MKSRRREDDGQDAGEKVVEEVVEVMEAGEGWLTGCGETHRIMEGCRCARGVGRQSKEYGQRQGRLCTEC